MTNNSISVAIITRNRVKLLQNCLKSLSVQTIMPLEVLLIDNASDDSTKQLAKEFKNILPLKYIYERKIGIPYARNRALKEAKGEILAFIDDDCEAEPNWAEEIIKVHRKYPKAAAIQGETKSKPKDGILASISETYHDIWLRKNLTRGNKLLICDTKNLSLKLKIISDLKIKFNTVYFRGSDVDFGKQLLAKRANILYEPGIINYHWERKDIGSFLVQKYYQGRSLAWTDIKWPRLINRLSAEKSKKLHAVFEENMLRGRPFWKVIALKLVIWLRNKAYNMGLRTEEKLLIREVLNCTPSLNSKKISVAIVTRNRSGLLNKVLASLAKQTIVPSEIILVDNGSTDNTKRVVYRYHKILHIRYIYEEGVSIPYVRNRVFEEARGKIIAFIDDDCEAVSNWVEEMVKAHREYPVAVAIQGMITNIKAEIFRSLWLKNNMINDPSLVVLDTKNVSFKKDLIKKQAINFDSNFTLGSEVDFAKQIREQKGQIAYVRNIQVYHKEQAGFFDLIRQAEAMGASQAKLEFKWHQRIPQQSATFRSEYEKFVKGSGKTLPLFQRWVHISYIYAYKSSFEKISKDIHALKNIIPVARSESLVLTAAIITRNRRNFLKQCLFSLSRQTIIPKEVLIIDNGSTDNTKVVASAFSKILPIRCIIENTIGIPYARNRALKEAKGDLLAFIDDDCEADENWIQNIEEAHRLYPEAIAVQGKTFSKPGDAIFSTMWENLYNLWLRKNIINRNCLLVLDTKNVSFKKAILKREGLFFNIAFDRGSDVDLAKQILAKKQNIIFDPKIHMYHWERSNIFSFLKQKYLTSKAAAKIDYIWPAYLFSGKRQIPPIKYHGMLNLLFILSENIFKIGYSLEKNKLFHELEYPHYLSCAKITKITANISVVIVTRNRDILLKQCLMSLVKQSVMPGEVLIIDNGSADNTKVVASAFSKVLPIRYIVENTVGAGSARNRALKEARGDLLAFIDDDCEATPNWIEEMVTAHRKYPAAAVIQGKSSVLNRQSVFGVIAHKHKNDWMDKNINGRYLRIFETQNSSLKKNLINRLGLRFDNSISKRFYYGEDPDFSAQLEVSKQKKIYYPNAEVFFRSRTNLFSFLKQRFLVGRTNRFLAYKWPNLYAFQSKNIDPKKNLLPISRNIRLSYSFVAYMSKLAYQIGNQIEAILLYSNFNRLYTFAGLRYTNEQLKKDTTRLSVMIITKDRSVSLKRCLESLVKQRRKPYEVIIVDSSKEPISSLALQFEKCLPIKYIYEKRLGFGVARNTGLEHATGDIIATIDDDEEAAPDWSGQIIAAHKRFPNAAAVQGRFICKPTSLHAIVEQIRLDRWFLNSLEYDNTIWVLSTKNASFKLAPIKKANIRFNTDPFYGINGGEDVDFGNKIRANNLQIIYAPSVVVYHSERSSIWEYLKQQCRKGKSRALIKRDWKELEEKKNTYSLPRFSHIADVFIHPLGKKNILFTPFLFFTYILSVYFYNKNLRNFVCPNPYTDLVNVDLKRKARSFTLAVITRNRADFLNRILLSITKQTLLPSSVLIIDNGSTDNTRETVSSFRYVLPVHYLYEARTGIPYARNRALKEAKGDILALIDDDCEILPTWVEAMLEAHKKYSYASAIQGRSISKPSRSFYGVVAQFNRQTWIRDNMLGDRNLYWKWVAGNLEKDFEILVCDTGNISIKLRHIRKLHINFDETFNFAKILLSNGQHIVFYPPALAYHYERNSLHGFLQQRGFYGKTNRSFLKPTLSFVYYCLKNKHFADIPLLVPLFLLQKMFYTYDKFINNRSRLS